MALKAPTPPTPPGPPTPPKVDLMEGGSVKETTVPQSHGPQTEDEIHEKQAREAVANGAGPLSKTTVIDGRKAAPGQNDEEAATPAAERATVGTQTAAGGSKTDRTELRQDAQAQMLLGEENRAEQSQSQQAMPPRVSESPGEHGMLYWGSILLAIAILVAAVLRKILFREKESSQEPETGLRAGMTAAEALENIRQREEKQPMVPPAHVAKEYAARAAAGEKSPPAKKLAPLRPSERKDGEERKRFEVRI